MKRRELLLGGLSLAALPWTAGAQELKPLRSDMATGPDFDALYPGTPHLVGVRPHRLGGVRLELQEAPLAGKRVLHNYGHGGAGITLAWGCAARMVQLIEPVLQDGSSVAVLGSGVAGLTVASELRRRWPALAVTVYARELDLTKTTSWVAGGQFEPSGIYREYRSPERLADLHALVRSSRDRMVQLGARYGVAERDNFTLDRVQKSMEIGAPPDVIAPPERGLLPFERLRAPGRLYKTWLMDPTRLLPTLVEDLRDEGVAFVKADFRSMEDLAALPQTHIINCTGYGSRALFGDEDVVPLRGHLLRLQRTDPGQDWFFAGGCENDVIAYVFCRNDDIVVGGTIVLDDDRTEVDDTDRPEFQRLHDNARKLFTGRVDACATSS